MHKIHFTLHLYHTLNGPAGLGILQEHQSKPISYVTEDGSGSAIISGFNFDQAMDRLGPLFEAARRTNHIRDIFDDAFIDKMSGYGISEENISRMRVLKMMRGTPTANKTTVTYQQVPNAIQDWIREEITNIRALLIQHNTKYSIMGIISDTQTIHASYEQKKWERIKNNLILKTLALRKGHVKEINTILKNREAEQVTIVVPHGDKVTNSWRE